MATIHAPVFGDDDRAQAPASTGSDSGGFCEV
jgi:hypothetical protein